MKNRWGNTSINSLNFWNSTEASLEKEMTRRKSVRDQRLNHVRNKFAFQLSLPPTHDLVSQVIKELVLAWDKEGHSKFSINTGNCDYFAQELLEIFPDGNTMWGEDVPEKFPEGVDPDGHCFFELHGKFFDSESPKGVDSPHELQFYQRGIEREEIFKNALTINERCGRVLA